MAKADDIVTTDNFDISATKTLLVNSDGRAVNNGIPEGAREITDAFVYYNCTTGTISKVETLQGTTQMISEVIFNAGSVGNEWYGAAQFELHKNGTVDSSQPSSSMISKVNLNNTNYVLLNNQTFGSADATFKFNHSAGVNKLVCITCKYYVR